MKTNIFLYIFSIYLVSCQITNALSPTEYIEWFQDNKVNLSIPQEMNDVKFTCSYLPSDLFLAKKIISGDTLPEDSQSFYFSLEIKILENNTDPLVYNINSEEERMKRLTYLISNAWNDAVIVYKSDSFIPFLHHFERTYHAGNSIKVMYVFNKFLPDKESVHFIFYDKIFNKGPIVFKFKSSIFNNIPKLQTKEI